MTPASLEANSNEIFPVPAHKSKIFNSDNSIAFSNTLNKPSFAKSVVGRDGKFLGGLNLFDFKNPLTIRTTNEI
jgi:hypothetical protein